MLMLRHRPTARLLGGGVFSIAVVAIVMGLRFGRAFNRAARVLSRAGVDEEFTLATAYPNWPTWWIPETAASFMTWVVIGGLGAWVAFSAKSREKQFR